MKTRAKHEADAERALKEIHNSSETGDVLFKATMMITQTKAVEILLDIHEMLDNRLPKIK